MALSRETVAKVNEWVTWFNWHSDKIAAQPLETKVDWLLKAMNGAYETLSMVAREAHGSRPVDHGGILLPRGFSWTKRNGE